MSSRIFTNAPSLLASRFFILKPQFDSDQNEILSWRDGESRGSTTRVTNTIVYNGSNSRTGQGSASVYLCRWCPYITAFHTLHVYLNQHGNLRDNLIYLTPHDRSMLRIQTLYKLKHFWKVWRTES